MKIKNVFLSLLCVIALGISAVGVTGIVSAKAQEAPPKITLYPEGETIVKIEPGQMAYAEMDLPSGGYVITTDGVVSEEQLVITAYYGPKAASAEEFNKDNYKVTQFTWNNLYTSAFVVSEGDNAVYFETDSTEALEMEVFVLELSLNNLEELKEGDQTVSIEGFSFVAYNLPSIGTYTITLIDEPLFMVMGPTYIIAREEKTVTDPDSEEESVIFTYTFEVSEKAYSEGAYVVFGNEDFADDTFNITVTVPEE